MEGETTGFELEKKGTAAFWRWPPKAWATAGLLRVVLSKLHSHIADHRLSSSAVVAQDFNSKTQKAEAGRVRGQPGLQSNRRAGVMQRNPASKGRTKKRSYNLQDSAVRHHRNCQRWQSGQSKGQTALIKKEHLTVNASGLEKVYFKPDLGYLLVILAPGKLRQVCCKYNGILSEKARLLT